MSKGIVCFLALLVIGFLVNRGHVIQTTSVEIDGAFDSTFTGERDTLEIDPAISRIFWKGTKMRGLGKHEGEIAIEKGFLLYQNNELLGGEIAVNMGRVTISDIPKTDPIPIRNLTNHLRSADFFDVDKHPFSHFKILTVQKSEHTKMRLTGVLTIKGISNPVSFDAENVDKNHFIANLEINRFDWDIAYSGSWVDRTLVDREIQLRIEIVCN